MIHVSIETDHDLTVDEVWPDKNGPVLPTADDVIEAMKKSRSVNAMAHDWNLDDYTVTVLCNGTKAQWRQ